MRKVLVLGGTAWLGSVIAEELLASGDQVTCLARGESGAPPSGAQFVQADRTSPDAYADVANQQWDEVIELGWDHRVVQGALAALADVAEHWTLISTVSVYASNTEPGADETAALLVPVDLDDYGQAKVAAENASRSALGDRLLTVRPGLIVGPGDGSDRFGDWVSRFALAGDGPVLCPETGGRTAQVIDVDDLAAFIVAAGRNGTTGIINAVGDEHSLADVLAAAAQTAGFTGEVVSASDEWLLDHEVRYWAGPRSLPLWVPRADAAFAQRDNSAFHAAGGQLRALPLTLQRVLDAERASGLDRPRRSGLTRAEELDLIGELRR